MTSSTWMLVFSPLLMFFCLQQSVQLSKGLSLVFIPTRPDVSSGEFLKYHFSTDFQFSLTGPPDFNPKFLSTISNFLRGMVKTHQPNILKPNPFSFQTNLPLPNSGCLWHCSSRQTRTQKAVLCWTPLQLPAIPGGAQRLSNIRYALFNAATFVACLLHWGGFPAVPSPPAPGPLL